MPPSGQHEHHSGTPVESETNRDCLSLSGQGPSRTECPPAATHLVAVWDLAACLAGLAPWEQQFVGLLCIRTLCFVCMPCSSIIAGNCGRQGRERSLQIDSSRDFSIASPVQRHPAPINELHFTRSTLPFQPSRESTITRLATPATNPPNAAVGSSLDTHNTGRHARTHHRDAGVRRDIHTHQRRQRDDTASRAPERAQEGEPRTIDSQGQPPRPIDDGSGRCRPELKRRRRLTTASARHTDRRCG
jgi:hypothetical protein